MPNEPVLTATNVSVTLDGLPIIRDVSFSVQQGEAAAVIGPNGAGKTMLFRALLGLVPYSGTIAWRPDVKIGYVPQRFSVERSAPITAKEFFLLQSPSFWKPARGFLGAVQRELAQMGLGANVLAKRLGELSGGETQRLLIAWAMLQHPDVLMLDEPTAGVDAGFEDTIYALLHRVQADRGTTLLLISHDLSVVYRYAQHVVCINKGVVCQGRPVEALNPAALAELFGDSGYYQHEHGLGH